MKITDLGITENEFYSLDCLEQRELLGDLYKREEDVSEVDIHKFETWKFIRELEGGFF